MFNVKLHQVEEMRSVYEGIGFCLDYLDDSFYTLGDNMENVYVKKNVKINKFEIGFNFF